MILSIDPTEFGKIKFSLDNRGKKTTQIFAVRPQESEKILADLEKFFKKLKIAGPQAQIDAIIVHNKKAGSFTGLRVATAIASALALVWGITVKTKA